MKQSCVIIKALSGFALLGTAIAQTPSTADAVFVGGTLIMRVRVAAGGFTIAQRAAQIQERVNDILGRGPIRPSNVTVEPSGNEAIVKVKDRLLLTADWDTARFNHTTPPALAEEWAAHMREILPGLTRPK